MNERIITIPAGAVNCYLIQGKENVLIDTGYGNSYERIEKVMKSYNLQIQSIQTIIITHGHNDHYGGLKKLKQQTKAQVVAHQKDVNMIQEGTNGELKPYGIRGRIIKALVSRRPAPLLDTVGVEYAIDTSISLEPFGIGGKIIETPGHTLGSISVLLETGDLFVGDLVMSMFPLEKCHLPFFVEDLNALYNSLEIISKESFSTLHMGHGKAITKEEFMKFYHKMQTKKRA